jgi:hypothetical protein
MVDRRVLLLMSNSCNETRFCQAEGRVPDSWLKLRSMDVSDVKALQDAGRVPFRLHNRRENEIIISERGGGEKGTIQKKNSFH